MVMQSMRIKIPCKNVGLNLIFTPVDNGRAAQPKQEYLISQRQLWSS